MDEGNRAMNIIDRIGNKQIEKVLGQRQLPEFAPGDTLRVDVKVVEGTRERIQAFEGVCIARKSKGVNSSFTVRKYWARSYESVSRGVTDSNWWVLTCFQLVGPNL